MHGIFHHKIKMKEVFSAFFSLVLRNTISLKKLNNNSAIHSFNNFALISIKKKSFGDDVISVKETLFFSVYLHLLLYT